MRRFSCLFALCAGLAMGAPARADTVLLRQALDEWLKAAVRALPQAHAKYEIGQIDANHPPPCATFDIELPAGARLWGRTYVVVRCVDGGAWSTYVPVRVKIPGRYVETRLALRAGVTVTADDVALVNGDLAEQPDGVILDQQQVIGMVPQVPVPAGKPLRRELLRPPLVVRQGQSVRVVSSGAGFNVSNEGRALNNATVNQVVQVRLENGRVVRGLAREDGTVEVTF